MRAPRLMLCVPLAALIACGGPQRRDTDRIDLDQNVTRKRQAQDRIFVDFEKNWRQFISTSPQLVRPVVTPEKPPQAPPWEPIVLAECVFSADADGLVPQVTLTWNEPVSGAPDVALAQQRQPGPPGLRFDLAVHYNGLARNYYSSALSAEKLERFKLPSTSALVNDQEAVLLTGPGLFPRLMDFSTELVKDRDTQAQFDRRTLILRDLSQGLSYTIRMDRPGYDRWAEDRRFVFLTPVCPA